MVLPGAWVGHEFRRGRAYEFKSPRFVPDAMPGVEAIYQQLTILLALATLSHFTIKRSRQPTIGGEIALGIVLAPSILGFYLNIRLCDPGGVSPFARRGATSLLLF